jgi:hypothetical protein
MSLGSGIFLAVVLLILAIGVWQIMTREKWKTVEKIAGALVGLGLMAAAVIFVMYADKDQIPRPSTISQLAGVKLGMSPTDVTLALGRPSISGKMEIDRDGQAHLTYVYTKDQNEDYSLDIIFAGADSRSTRAVIICEKGGFSNLLGLDRYSSEQDVLRNLGTPSYSSIRNDGLEKAISYAAWNASFKVARGRVIALCIHQGNFILYDREIAQRSKGS